ncbi:unnamed protein product [Moneuplotes crassus]|uniref:Uncharacterized protein n=1 Tax=Euplotes crassus TaxID=5936 RepID=A0AAD1TZ50_EUPCR|nr:unnamed protein product [Moneuplotes crassus]
MSDSTLDLISGLVNVTSLRESWSDSPLSEIEPQNWKNIPVCVIEAIHALIQDAKVNNAKFSDVSNSLNTQDTRIKKKFQIEEKEMKKSRDTLLAQMSRLESQFQQAITQNRMEIESMVSENKSAKEDIQTFMNSVGNLDHFLTRQERISEFLKIDIYKELQTLHDLVMDKAETMTDKAIKKLTQELSDSFNSKFEVDKEDVVTKIENLQESMTDSFKEEQAKITKRLSEFEENQLFVEDKLFSLKKKSKEVSEDTEEQIQVLRDELPTINIQFNKKIRDLEEEFKNDYFQKFRDQESKISQGSKVMEALQAQVEQAQNNFEKRTNEVNELINDLIQEQENINNVIDEIRDKNSKKTLSPLKLDERNAGSSLQIKSAKRGSRMSFLRKNTPSSANRRLEELEDCIEVRLRQLEEKISHLPGKSKGGIDEELEYQNSNDTSLIVNMNSKNFERLQSDISILKDNMIKLQTMSTVLSPAKYDKSEKMDMEKSFNEHKNMVAHKSIIKRIQSIKPTPQIMIERMSRMPDVKLEPKIMSKLTSNKKIKERENILSLPRGSNRKINSSVINGSRNTSTNFPQIRSQNVSPIKHSNPSAEFANSLIIPALKKKKINKVNLKVNISKKTHVKEGQKGKTVNGNFEKIDFGGMNL